MRRVFFRHFASILWLCAFWSPPAFAAPPPLSCRSITLKGKIETPANFPMESIVQLSMTYQMSYQKNPALLFLKQPLQSREFEVTLFSTPPIVPRKRHFPGVAESRPESLPATLSVSESLPETQASPERLSLGFVAEKMFLYPREIDFQYSAQSLDGQWRSSYLKTHYLHERKKVDGKWECESTVELQPLSLQAR